MHFSLLNAATRVSLALGKRYADTADRKHRVLTPLVRTQLGTIDKCWEEAMLAISHEIESQPLTNEFLEVQRRLYRSAGGAR